MVDVNYKLNIHYDCFYCFSDIKCHWDSHARLTTNTGNKRYHMIKGGIIYFIDTTKNLKIEAIIYNDDIH